MNSDSVLTESQCVEGYDSDAIINFACTPLYSNYAVTIEQYDAQTDLTSSSAKVIWSVHKI